MLATINEPLAASVSRSRLLWVVNRLLGVVELATLILTGFLTSWWLSSDGSISLEQWRTVARAVLFWLLVVNAPAIFMGRQKPRNPFDGVGSLLLSWVALFVLMGAYAWLISDLASNSPLWWCTWALLSFSGALVLQFAWRLALSRMSVRARRLRSVVLGGEQQVDQLIHHFQTHSALGIDVVGNFTFDADASPAGLGAQLPELHDFLQKNRVDQVWLSLSRDRQAVMADVMEAIRHTTADVKLVPDVNGLNLLNHSVESVAGLPVINLRKSPNDLVTRAIKRGEDLVIGSAILLMISPLMLLIALGVKLSSAGPVFFKQKRHGRNGQIIEVWKFRSMRVHNEHDGKVTQATKNDSRVTAFGSFLRRTSLDELPQFINVLQGQMSIVGPRPHAIAHNMMYMDQVSDYMQRHRIKPGITGWAQVNGLRGETDTLEKMQKRVEFDLFYLKNWSLGFDLKIIVMTVFKGFINSNAY